MLALIEIFDIVHISKYCQIITIYIICIIRI
jgi:hypothetical protein